MKRFAIYTAIVGGYDLIKQPLVVDDRFDYILFSDCIKEKQVGVWQIRQIDYHNENQVKIARYVKTHPHTLLGEYDTTLWIDASVLIKSNYIYQRIDDLYKQNVFLACHIHPERDCIYDEMFTVLDNKLETEEIILRWGHELRKHQYPRHNGLCETGILFRVNEERMAEFNERWWNCIEIYSRRDQLSFNLVLSLLRIPFESILPSNVPVRESDHIEINSHFNVKSKFDGVGTDSWLMKYYRKHPSAEEQIKKVYYKIYSTSNPPMWAAFWGQIFRVRDFLARKLA